jgi:hypothetical protein
MCNDISWLQDATTTSHMFVRTAGSEKIKSKIIGKAIIPLREHGTIIKILDAMACRFVPGLRKNLLSVARLTEQGYEVTFVKDTCVARNSKGNITFTAKKINGLYVLPTNIVSTDVYAADIQKELNIPEIGSTVELWHKRLAHRDMRVIKRMCQNEGYHMNTKLCVPGCPECKLGKSHRLPFKQSIPDHANQPLEQVRFDGQGPYTTKSRMQNSWWITFLDGCSGWVALDFLQHKSQSIEFL